MDTLQSIEKKVASMELKMVTKDEMKAEMAEMKSEMKAEMKTGMNDLKTELLEAIKNMNGNAHR